MTNTANIQRGFTLIEVLVTMIILSVGLIGMAGLQATGLKSNNRALHRTQASFLAYDIIERMRANAGSINQYAISLGSTPASVTECAAVGAAWDSTALAYYDVAFWQCSVNSACTDFANGYLPNGKGSITIAGNTAEVKIQWVTGTNKDGDLTEELTIASDF